MMNTSPSLPFQSRFHRSGFAWFLFLCGTVLFSAVGCEPEEENRSLVEGSTSVLHSDLVGSDLRILVVNDPPLAAAIERWQMEWKTLSSGTYKVSATNNELPNDWSSQYDVVIYPAELLGELVENRWIMPIRTGLLEQEDYGLSDVFPLIWEHEVRWGGQPYALSLGAPVLSLAYRTDLFTEQAQSAPTTWTKYQELVEYFDDSDHWGKFKPAEGVKWQATVEPLAPGWAAQTFLARAAAYARHRNQVSTFFDSQTMEPLIATPPFERALDEIVAAAGPDSLSLNADPQGAFDALANGQCAMALTWFSAAGPVAATGDATAATKKPSELAGHIALEELPGAKESYNLERLTWEERSGEYENRVTFLGMAGCLGSVSSNSRNAPNANRLLAWMTRSEVSQRICNASAATTLFRLSHVGMPEPWLGKMVESTAARQYTRTMESALSRTQFLIGPRIPGSARYMAALDEAVRSAAAGKQKSAEALKQADKAWRAITAEFDLEKQRIAYLRSLGEISSTEKSLPAGEEN